MAVSPNQYVEFDFATAVSVSSIDFVSSQWTTAPTMAALQYYNGSAWVSNTSGGAVASTSFRIYNLGGVTANVTRLRLGYGGAYPAYLPSISSATYAGNIGVGITTTLDSVMSSQDISGSEIWTLVSGSVPAGVSISSAGSISGSPTTAGTSTLVYSVTDSRGYPSVQQTLTFQVSYESASAVYPSSVVNYSSSTINSKQSNLVSALYDAQTTTSIYVNGSFAVQEFFYTYPIPVQVSSVNFGITGGANDVLLYYCPYGTTCSVGNWSTVQSTGWQLAGSALGASGISNFAAVSGSQFMLCYATSTGSTCGNGTVTQQQLQTGMLGDGGNFPPDLVSVSQTYTGSISKASGGTITLTPINLVGTGTWSVVSGTLPAGVSLSSSGVISGTPTGANGNTTFYVSVTDSATGFTSYWNDGTSVYTYWGRVTVTVKN